MPHDMPPEDRTEQPGPDDRSDRQLPPEQLSSETPLDAQLVPPLVQDLGSADAGNPFADALEPWEGVDEALDVEPDQLPLWPAFVVVLGAIAAALVVSGVAIGVAAVATGNLQAMRQPANQMSWLLELASTPGGLTMLILPGQLVFGLAALVAAALSRERWVDRLGLRRGRLPMWTWPLFLAGTPVIGVLAGYVLSHLADEPSESLKMLEQMLQFDSATSLITLLVLVGVLPGISEELLFRGFMQRRLLARLPVGLAIVICSMFFAAAHMDGLHALGVFPLGIWLGVIAWRGLDVACHVAHMGNNAFAIVMAKMMGDGSDLTELGPIAGPIFLVSLCCFAAAILVLLAAPVLKRLPVPVEQ